MIGLAQRCAPECYFDLSWVFFEWTLRFAHSFCSFLDWSDWRGLLAFGIGLWNGICFLGRVGSKHCHYCHTHIRRHETVRGSRSGEGLHFILFSLCRFSRLDLQNANSNSNSVSKSSIFEFSIGFVQNFVVASDFRINACFIADFEYTWNFAACSMLITILWTLVWDGSSEPITDSVSDRQRNSSAENLREHWLRRQDSATQIPPKCNSAAWSYTSRPDELLLARTSFAYYSFKLLL